MIARMQSLILAATLCAVGQLAAAPIHDACRTGDLDAARRLVAADKKVLAAPNPDEGKRTPLHLAAAAGHTDLVRWLLDAGAPVDPRDDIGATPLELAASAGHLEIAKRLIGRGADVNNRRELDPKKKDKKRTGESVLHAAAREGHTPIVQLLIAHKADVNYARGSDGETPLHEAAGKGSLELVRALVEAGAKVEAVSDENSTPVLQAGYGGNVELVKFLVARGADLKRKEKDGTTALHWAAFGGKLEMIRYLLDQGLELEAKGMNQKDSPLTVATLGNHPEAATLLLDRGASMYQKNKYAMSPLCYASWLGKEPVLKVFLKREAKIETRYGSWNNTPLFFAIRYSRIEAIRMLLEAGADPNATQSFHLDGVMRRGINSLHVAVWAQDVRIIDMLLEAGADPLFKSAQGETPVNWARQFGGYAVQAALAKAIEHPNPKWPSQKIAAAVDALSQAIVDGDADKLRAALANPATGKGLNRRDENQNTPLHLAARFAGADCVKILLQAGSFVDSRNDRRFTPLHMAVFSNNLQAARQLVESKAYLNARNDQLQTPLHLAARSGKAELVKLLLEAGARADIRDHSDKTPADLATNPEIRRLLAPPPPGE